MWLFSLMALCAVNLWPAHEDAANPQERQLELTVEQCVEKALQNNPNLSALDYQEAARRANIQESWGTFDPIFRSNYLFNRARRETTNFAQAGSSASFVSETQSSDSSIAQNLLTGGSYQLSFIAASEITSADQSFTFFNPSLSTTLQLAVSQPLLRGAWTTYSKAPVYQAEISYDIAKRTFAENLMQTIFDVHAAYWDLVFSLQDVEVKEFAVNLAEELKEINEKKVEEGVSAPVEVLQAETEIAQRKEELLGAQNTLRASEDSLKQLVFPFQNQEEWRISIKPISELPTIQTEELDWQNAISIAFVNRPELERARLNVKSLELNLDVAESDLMPRLDLVGATYNQGLDNHFRRSYQDIQGSDFPNYNVGLNLEIPIGNVGAKGRVRAAKADLSASMQTLRSEENRIAREVRDAIRELNFARESILASRKSRELAQEQLEAETRKYEVGLSTNYQVLEFQRDLSQALSDEKAAQANYAKALIGIKRAQGTLKP